MSQDQDFIRVGIVGRAHGVKGAVRVFTDEPQSDTLARAKEVRLGNGRTPYKVVKSSQCGRFTALELEGVGSRDEAFALTGSEVFVSRRALRPLRNAFYACDLIGLAIVDENGKTWGIIDGIVPSGAHDMLRYASDSGTAGLVPFVAAHVGKVDLENKTVAVDADWMAELDAVYKG